MNSIDYAAIRATERLMKKILKFKKDENLLKELYDSVNHKRYEEIVFNAKVPREYDDAYNTIIVAIPVVRRSSLCIGIYLVNDNGFREYKIL